MERSEISRIAHADHPIAAPVSADRLREIVSALTPPDDASILDLGCGEGAWLLRALQVHPGARGVGVDLVLPPEVDAEAARRGVSDRARWVQDDAAGWSDGLHDVVFCVGASHAFGGLEGTLTSVRAHLRPGGQVVLGDGIWDSSPSQAALDALQCTADDFPYLDGLVRQAVAHGFEVVHGHVSTLAEWDDYEWSWTGSLVRWALRQPVGSAQREEALAAARSHRDEWLGGYRGQLGFATLVLSDVLSPPQGSQVPQNVR